MQMKQDFKNHAERNEYYKMLLFHKEIGRPARAYLKSRNITKETAIFWEIGYCPEYQLEINHKGELAGAKLRGRITYPIRNQHGEVISVGGRTIINANPKYDAFAIATRKNLFGLWNNKDEIRNSGKAIITEGQIDVIQAWQYGVRNMVCSFGAHLSLSQISLLSRYADEIIIVYDNDNAGREGANAAKEFMNKGDVKITICDKLPFGEDVDSYLKKFGKDQFLELLKPIEKIDTLMNKLNLLKRNSNRL